MTAITRPARTSLPPAPQSVNGAPRVTVVIPTHNRAALVVRAIRSVLAQTMSDFELIVVDDGSADDTAAVVPGIDDARVMYVRLDEAGGPARARNEGIARARGEWVGFLDDDDEWLPDKLEKQLARVTAAPDASVIYGRMCVQTKDEFRWPKVERPLPEGDLTTQMLRQNMIVMPSAFLVRRAALFEVGGFDESLQWGEDRDLWLRLCQAGETFVATPDPVIVYHTSHDGRLSIAWATATCSLARYQRRWDALERRRLTPDELRADRTKRRRWMERSNRKMLRRLVRSGRRRRAWRYVVTIAPAMRTLPWLAPFVAQAMAIVLLGRSAARLPGMPQRKAPSPASAQNAPDETR